MEGGWPKEIDVAESDQVISSRNTNTLRDFASFQISRFIKKIEKDDKFLTSCLTIAKEAEHKVKQNNCVDIYRLNHLECHEYTQSLPVTGTTLTMRMMLPERWLLTST